MFSWIVYQNLLLTNALKKMIDYFGEDEVKKIR